MVNLVKKDITKSIIFLTAICAAMSFFMFTDKLYVGHDTSFHLYRFQGIINALQDRQFPIKIYPYSNNGFGYAEPLFYCDLLLFPFAFLYWAGVPVVISYKIMRCFYICLSVLSIYYVSNKIFCNSKYAPYIATLLYSFCNYHLYDIYVRDAVGEMLAFVFIPFIILSIYDLFINNKDCWVQLGLSFAFLALSHLISFLMYCFVFLIVIIFFYLQNIKNKKLLIKQTFTIIKAVILGMCISSFFVFPMLEQLTSQKFWVSYYRQQFDVSNTAKISEMIFKPFVDLINYRSTSINNDCLFNLGYIMYFFQLIYLYIIYIKKSNKFFTLLFIISLIFMALSLGIVPIKFSFINTIQFAFRFNIVCFPLLSFVITYCLVTINKKLYIITISLIIIYSIINIGVVYYQQKFIYNFFYNDDTIEELYRDPTNGNQSFAILELSAGDYLPANDVWHYFWPDATYIKIVDEDRYNYREAVYQKGGEFCLVNYEKDGTKISFDYETKYNEIIMLPVSYYKGYSFYAIDENGNKYDLEREELGRYKQVAFRSVIGKCKYYCFYKGTSIQKISFYLSLASTIFLIVILSKRALKEHNLFLFLKK